MNLWLIVPAKPFDEGKSRLADTLLPHQRAAINKNLLTQVLHTTNSAGLFTGTAVISRSKQVLEHASSLGAIKLLENEDEVESSTSSDQSDPHLNSTPLPTSAQTEPPSGRYHHRYCVGKLFDHRAERNFNKTQPSVTNRAVTNKTVTNRSHRRSPLHNEDRLNRALAQAKKEVVARGADALLVLPTDLPLLTIHDVSQLYALGARQNGVVISRSHDGGTNALLLRPPNAIDFAFGSNSFQQHYASTIAAGYPCQTLESPTLAFDLDGPEDWRRWQESTQDRILS